MIAYLIGFMGSGKSTIGRKIAARLKWSFIDLDRAIEEHAKNPVSEIFKEKGEPFFRHLESDVLRSYNSSSNIVIACGGGTPCFNNNMDYMNETGVSVYIKMTPAALKSRLIANRAQRPLIAEKSDEELLGYIHETLGYREEWYSKSKIEIEGLDPDIIQLCELLLAQAP